MTPRRIRIAAAVIALIGGCLPTGASPGAFEDWIAALRVEALGRDISAATVDAALAGVRPSAKVLELDRKQPEFKLTFDQYLGRVINDRRVSEGRRLLDEHHALLEEIGARYGVQPRFIVALWGIESDYGRRLGTFPVIEALVTLAYDERRADFFRGELFHALRILDQGHVQPERMLGSWAGAMGQPQFMPSSFHSFAVDHDGDARRDLWGSVPDVLASVANYLSRSGWQGDRTWGREVELPPGFDPALAGRKNGRPLGEWSRLGVRGPGGGELPVVDFDAAIVLPDGPDGPDGPGGRAFAVYANFGVLLKWNRSEFFAASVGILADRLVDR